MITSQPNMGNKYPFQSNNKSNKVNQNIFTRGSEITTNNQNDIHRRDAHAIPSYTLRSSTNRYITPNGRVIHKQSSGARLADIRPKWSDHNINTIGQAVKVGNKYPSTK